MAWVIHHQQCKCRAMNSIMDHIKNLVYACYFLNYFRVIINSMLPVDVDFYNNDNDIKTYIYQ